MPKNTYKIIINAKNMANQSKLQLSLLEMEQLVADC